MLMLFFTTLKDGEPKWIGAESLIGISPGVGLNPKQAPELIDSSMIQFNKESDKDTGSVAGWGGWAERANKYLSELKTGDKVCSVGNAATADEACKFDKVCSVGNAATAD